MARLGVAILAFFILISKNFANPISKNDEGRIAPIDFVQKQIDTMLLFFHIHEPLYLSKYKDIIETWSLENRLELFKDPDAVKIWTTLLKNDWLLPRHVPFTINEETHKDEASLLFRVLYSAKDYDTFYKTAVYVRNYVNEDLFVYVMTTAILHRQDLAGFIMPPIYEIAPEYFHDGQIMALANRLNVLGNRDLDNYKSLYKIDNHFVIRSNYTAWASLYDKPLHYYSHDKGLILFYYYFNLMYPSWLGKDLVPLRNDNRGEWIWFIHKEMVSIYNLHRLSNGLPEIEDLSYDIVEEGYNPGMIYHSGIPFPSRHNKFNLDHPEFLDELRKIEDYERRVRDAIEQGYIIDSAGEKIDLKTPESIDVIGRIIEASVDSPNGRYYKDFVSLWKSVLGNSRKYDLSENYMPLVVPSVLEHPQTALSDPAFYMIWKRVLNLFRLWQEQLPLYTREELALPSVEIEDVEVDKLVTYFENTLMNVSASLCMNEDEANTITDDVSVLVEYPRLNHKKFNVRIRVKSSQAQNVTVRFFLGPKYDSKKNKIPLYKNTENFYMMEEFVYELPKGDHVIIQKSTNCQHLTYNLRTAEDVYQEAIAAVHGDGKYHFDPTQIIKFPGNLILPKGRIGGMPFVLLVHITEYKPPRLPVGSTFDPELSYGAGSGSRQLAGDPLGYPLNRPLHHWQVNGLRNFYFHDVLIYHNPTPEISVPYSSDV